MAATKKQIVNFSNDLGYGSLKGRLDNHRIQFPTVVAQEGTQDEAQPIMFDSVQGEQRYIDHILDHLDVSVHSPSIRHMSGRYLVGPSAVASNLPLDAFDVEDLSGKSDTDLSLVITLTTIAGWAVKKYFTKFKSLPQTNHINVNVNMATALPILEGKRNDTIAIYKRRYTATDHIVVLHNFMSPVKVHIHFGGLVVMLEGQAAHYANAHCSSRKLKKGIRDDFTEHYPQFDKFSSAVIGRTLRGAMHTMGIDIGEGTTDFDVFNNKGGISRLNIRASNSIRWGYGHILNKAIQTLKDDGQDVENRAGLKELLDQPTTLFNRDRKAEAQQAVDDQAPRLVSYILDAVSQTLRRVQANIDVIYVYGGGSIPMEKYLRKPLMAKTATFRSHGIPIIFIPAQYAQFMNELGLHWVLEQIEK